MDAHDDLESDLHGSASSRTSARGGSSGPTPTSSGRPSRSSPSSPAGPLSLQYHDRRAEFWVALDPGLEVTVGDRVWSPAPNEEIFIPRKALHRPPGPRTAAGPLHGDLDRRSRRIRHRPRLGRFHSGISLEAGSILVRPFGKSGACFGLALRPASIHAPPSEDPPSPRPSTVKIPPKAPVEERGTRRSHLRQRRERGRPGVAGDPERGRSASLNRESPSGSQRIAMRRVVSAWPVRNTSGCRMRMPSITYSSISWALEACIASSTIFSTVATRSSGGPS